MGMEENPHRRGEAHAALEAPFPLLQGAKIYGWGPHCFPPVSCLAATVCDKGHEETFSYSFCECEHVRKHRKDPNPLWRSRFLLGLTRIHTELWRKCRGQVKLQRAQGFIIGWSGKRKNKTHSLSQICFLCTKSSRRWWEVMTGLGWETTSHPAPFGREGVLLQVRGQSWCQVLTFIPRRSQRLGNMSASQMAERA